MATAAAELREQLNEQTYGGAPASGAGAGKGGRGADEELFRI